MAYLYRRKDDLVDLFIDRTYAKDVIIGDGSSEGGDYVAVINGFEFREEDPTPGSDSSSTIASNLETAINNSAIDITASSSSNVVTLTADQPGVDFSLEVETTDDNGTIYERDNKPEAYQIKHASNWDGTFSTIETVPARGSTSDSVYPDRSFSDSNYEDKYTRFRFAPSDFGMRDDHLQFFKYTPVFDGSLGSDSRIHIVLAPEQARESSTTLILRGDAPIASGPDGAFELVFPSHTSSIEVKNTSDPAELIHFSWGSGSEWTLAQGESFGDNKLNTPNIKVRTDSGAGSAAEVSIYATINLERGI